MKHIEHKTRQVYHFPILYALITVRNYQKFRNILQSSFSLVMLSPPAGPKMSLNYCPVTVREKKKIVLSNNRNTNEKEKTFKNIVWITIWQWEIPVNHKTQLIFFFILIQWYFMVITWFLTTTPPVNVFFWKTFQIIIIYISHLISRNAISVFFFQTIENQFSPPPCLPPSIAPCFFFSPSSLPVGKF